MNIEFNFFEIGVVLRKQFYQVLRFISLLILLILSSSSFSSGGIEGKLNDAPKGSVVKLYYLLGTTPQLIDSAELKSGKFKISSELKRGYYRFGSDQDNSRVVVYGKEPLVLEGDWGKWNDISINPDNEDKLFNSFQDIIFRGNKGVQKIGKQAQQLSRLQRSNPEEYSLKMETLKRQFDSVMLDQEQALYKLNAENEATFIGKMAGFLLKNEEVNAYDYFDVEELKDPENLSGEMVKTKLSIYFQRYLGGNVKNWEMRYDQFLAACPPGDPKMVLYSAGMEIFVNLDQNYSARLAREFYKEFPKNSLAVHYYNQLPKPPPSVGDIAPNISLKSPSGEIMELADLKGKVVLLDFWASWCGPCRRENPNVVKAYNAYKDKGFTVFSVSLDNNKDKWLGAIKKDGLVWENHVSDLKGWKSAGAKKYGVRGIPATFLIDDEGVIRAVNVRGARLEKELDKLLETAEKDG